MASELRVNQITSQTGLGTVTFDAAGGVSFVNTTPTFNNVSLVSINGGPISGFKNRLINGDMRIDQRQAGAASTTNNGYPVDRWKIEYTGNGVLTGIQTTDVPSGQGFTNALRLTSTARSTLSSGDYYQLTHYMEGNTTSDLNFGSSSAKTVTLSFWVKGSRTGTYNAQLANTGTRTYTRQYTISSADTWQKVVLTYPGCPDGTWLTTNGVGFSIRFGFEYGSTYAGGTTDTWLSRSLFETSFPSMTNTFTTNSNSTWFITGIQLEQGNIATDFERRPYGQELALCQRYYEKSYAQSTVPGTNTSTGQLMWGPASVTAATVTERLTAVFKVTKRTTSPTLTWYDSAGNAGKCNLPDTTGNRPITQIYASDSSSVIEATAGSSTSDWRMYAHFTADAEL